MQSGLVLDVGALFAMIMVGVIFFCICLFNDRRSYRRRMSENRAAEELLFRSLPKFTYNSTSNSGGGSASTECAICLAEYADGDEVRELPQCGHGFHPECVDTWVRSHSSCPTCRQSLTVVKPPSNLTSIC